MLRVSMFLSIIQVIFHVQLRRGGTLLLVIWYKISLLSRLPPDTSGTLNAAVPNNAIVVKFHTIVSFVYIYIYFVYICKSNVNETLTNIDVRSLNNSIYLSKYTEYRDVNTLCKFAINEVDSIEVMNIIVWLSHFSLLENSTKRIISHLLEKW